MTHVTELNRGQISLLMKGANFTSAFGAVGRRIWG